MYAASVTVFNHILNNLEVLLDKGAAFADERKIDHNALLLSRLSPDMFTLTRQVQIAQREPRRRCRWHRLGFRPKPAGPRTLSTSGLTSAPKYQRYPRPQKAR